jgi:hypothetical protein
MKLQTSKPKTKGKKEVNPNSKDTGAKTSVLTRFMIK